MTIAFRLFTAFGLLILPCLGDIQMPRDHHYAFAHRVLVKAMGSDDFLPSLEKKKATYLKGLWREAQKQARDRKRVSLTGLDYKLFEQDDRKIVVVILPEAKNITEAMLVGAEFKNGKAEGVIYTLEKGFNGITLGDWHNGAHLNFGEGPENDPEQFRDTILRKNKDS